MKFQKTNLLSILKLAYYKGFLVLLYMIIGLHGYAQDIPPKPSFIPALVDSTNTLSQTQFKRLSEKLEKYSDSTSTEIFTMIVNTVHGEEIKYHATQLAHKWEIGQKGKDNGIIVLLALKDRKVAIQTGYGVEHLLTDALSRRIINNVYTPFFKQGNYYEGLDRGADVMFEIT